MKALVTIQFLLMLSLTNCKGQAEFGTDKLSVQKLIPLPGVTGRIDHLAVNLKDKILYVAALGNNTVEIIDLNKGAVVHSIKGVEAPQGLAYIPEQNEIAVASGENGDCIFYNAATFQKLATIHLGEDADNIRYDPTERKMYVGYGNGAMALIDPAAHKQIADVKLPAHPEAFQLNKKNNKLFVNLPDDHSIGVIDLRNFKIIDMWKISRLRANFPMTLDTAKDLVFVGFRHPAVLVGYDGKIGKEVTKAALTGDCDDVFYDGSNSEIIASGGEGTINIFGRGSDNLLKLIAKINTRSGARTSLLIPSLRYYVLAERAEEGKNAAIVVYGIK